MKQMLLNVPRQELLQRMEELLEELIEIVEIAGLGDYVEFMVKIYELRVQLEEIKGESENE